MSGRFRLAYSVEPFMAFLWICHIFLASLYHHAIFHCITRNPVFTALTVQRIPDLLIRRNQFSSNRLYIVLRALPVCLIISVFVMPFADILWILLISSGFSLLYSLDISLISIPTDFPLRPSGDRASASDCSDSSKAAVHVPDFLRTIDSDIQPFPSCHTETDSLFL